MKSLFYPRPSIPIHPACILELPLKLQNTSLRNMFCPYCGAAHNNGELIAGEYGVKWGHAECTLAAFNEYRLVRSPINKDRFPWYLNVRCLNNVDSQMVLDEIGEMGKLPHSTNGAVVAAKSERWTSKHPRWHNFPREVQEQEEKIQKVMEDVKKKGLTVNEEKLKRIKAGLPEQRCEHFKPQVIMPVVMHERMRPSQRVVSLENWVPTLEELWKKLGNEKFQEWKRKQRELPFCGFHQGLWTLNSGEIVQVTLNCDLHADGLGRKWIRFLYWTCPGTPKDWDGCPPIRG